MAFTCQQLDELIERAVEGELDSRQARALERHLDECERCRRRYEREKRAAAALRTMPEVPVPAGLVERVMAALPAVPLSLLSRLAKVLQRAAYDLDLRRRLRENPQAALLSLHITLPPGMRVQVVSTQPAPLPTAAVLYLPLPEVPLRLEEKEQRLAAMGLGSIFGFWW